MNSKITKTHDKKKAEFQKERDIFGGRAVALVQQVIDYIEEHLLEKISPRIIANHFFMSISSLQNIFKMLCSMTIMEYIRNRRLSLAGQELLRTDSKIIDLAYDFGYETPEAFTKAFTRFHGFPPSIVRRIYPALKVFHPMRIQFEVLGGWEQEVKTILTKETFQRQEEKSLCCYDETTNLKGGTFMQYRKGIYEINRKDRKEKKDWDILLDLAKKLDEAGILFKVDGKTMIFVHGLEFPLEKICLTFQWKDEQKILDFFGHPGPAKETFPGFKYFDTTARGKKIRCMFYNCAGEDSETVLYRNTDQINIDGQLLHAQSLEFYYQNAEPKDEYYDMVEEWLKKQGNIVESN